MTLSEKQTAWVAKYAVISDPQERLAALVARKSRLEPLREGERCDANLVPGCVSRVWLAGEVREGALRLRIDADAALVRGLAAFVAEFFDGAATTDIVSFSGDLLAEVGVARLLTPTRAHGLGQVAARIRALAANA